MMKNAKVVKALGLKAEEPKVGLEEGLLKMIKWFEEKE